MFTNDQAALFRAIVAATLAARSDIYRTPALEPFSGHGCSAINAKLQQLLKKFTSVPGAATIVAEEVAALSKIKRTTPTKPTASKLPATPISKKRKAVKEEEEED
jgi:hypothetical protein